MLLIYKIPILNTIFDIQIYDSDFGLSSDFEYPKHRTPTMAIPTPIILKSVSGVLKKYVVKTIMNTLRKAFNTE
jgi:hypothetical protein